MTIFTAYQKPETGETTCLPDRFNWLAFWLPPVWAIAHHLWRDLIGMVAVVILLALVAGYFELPFWALYLAGVLWLGFEANPRLGRALMRNGWRLTGAVHANDRVGAETEMLRRAGQI